MSKQRFWKERRVIVSGGTSGLGQHLVLELSKVQANVVILGRNRERLEATKSECIDAGAASVQTFALDVTSPLRIESNSSEFQSSWLPLIEFIRQNSIDMLVNVVGRSDRGTIEQLATNDLKSQFEDNVVSALHTTQACFGALKQTSGVIVNIASLAGIIASPGIGGYAIAKHAMVAMHRQLQVENHDSGVHFLLVCPGPIARQDSETRYESLTRERGLSDSQSKPGAGAKLKLLDPQDLSIRILDAAANRKRELVLPGKARFLAALFPLFPALAEWLLRRNMSR